MASKSPNTALVGAALLVSLVGGTLLGAYVMTTPDARKVPTALRKPGKEVVQSAPRRIVPVVSGTEVTYREEDVKVPDGVDKRVFLVNEYLNQLHARGLGDKSARVIGIDVRNGTAFLAFNPAFEQTYGTSDEGIVLNGILRTLSQFPEIEKVQFEIDGKPMDTLGNIDLSQPQIVTGPGVAPVSTSPALP